MWLGQIHGTIFIVTVCLSMIQGGWQNKNNWCAYCLNLSTTVFIRWSFAKIKSFTWCQRDKLNCHWNSFHLQIWIFNSILPCRCTLQWFPHCFAQLNSAHEIWLCRTICNHCKTHPQICNSNFFIFVYCLCTIGKHTVKIKFVPYYALPLPEHPLSVSTVFEFETFHKTSCHKM